MDSRTISRLPFMRMGQTLVQQTHEENARKFLQRLRLLQR